MNEREWLASDDPGAMLAWLQRDRRTNHGHCRGPGDRKLRLFACALSRRMVMRHGQPDVAAIEDACDDPAVDWGRWRCRSLTDGGGYWCAEPDAARGVAMLLATSWALDHPAACAALLRDVVGNPWRPVTLPAKQCWDCDGKKEFLERTGQRDYGGGYRKVKCDTCDGTGQLSDCPWLTPQVLTLARAAYEERPGGVRGECEGKKGWWHCNGCGGEWRGDAGPDCFVCGHPYLTRKTCDPCKGTGRIEDGTLDPFRLALVADALEEAGCDSEELLRHLRGEGPVPNLHLQFGQRDPVPLAYRPLPGPHVRGCWAVDCILGKE